MLLVIGLQSCATMAPLKNASTPNPNSEVETHSVDIPSLFNIAESLASDPITIESVLHQNQHPPKGLSKLTELSWKALSPSSKTVIQLTQNKTAQNLRNKVPIYVTEGFVSDAKGLKVCFLSKTTTLNHSGQAKHEEPMNGKRWKSTIEFEKSTGQHILQVAVPVFKNHLPIGSLVLGISVARYLKHHAQ